MATAKFSNRTDAGRRLGEKIKALGLEDPLVLAIPRGGVPLAKEVAEALNADLDLVLAHKFTSPDRPELALGSVTDAGDLWIGPQAAHFGFSEDELQKFAEAEIERLRLRRHELGRVEEALDPMGRDVIIVDDGIATGSTVVAAVRSMRERNSGRIVVACPVASVQAVNRLRSEGAELCILQVPESFQSVSLFYDDFDQVSDVEVAKVLRDLDYRAKKAGRLRAHRNSARKVKQEIEDVHLNVSDAHLSGTLRRPEDARGLVIFVSEGLGSRLRPREQIVARALNKASFATLLLDLRAEDGHARDRWSFVDMNSLAKRVSQAIAWTIQHPLISSLPIGLFGSDAAVAAALMAAADHPAVRAVISRGGRPDLASQSLPFVQAPTLLLVGSEDRPVIELNRKALEELKCEKALVLVPGAGHRFQEPGSLEEVARLAQLWYARFLVGDRLHTYDEVNQRTIDLQKDEMKSP